MIRRAALLASVLALAAAAAAQPADAAISIFVRPHAVRYGHKVHINGRVSTHDKRKVVLDAARFPFDGGLRKVATTTTSSDGFYTFVGQPSLANRLRVRTKDGSSTSGVATVYVLPRKTDFSCTLESSDGHEYPCSGSSASGKLKLHWSYHVAYPGPVYGKESAKRVYVYYGQRNGSQEHPSSVRLRKTVAQTGIGKHHTSVRVTLRITAPKGPWAAQISTCTRWTEKSDGFGLPSHHGCGQQTVTYAQATSKRFG